MISESYQNGYIDGSFEARYPGKSKEHSEIFAKDIEYKSGYTNGFLFIAAATYSAVDKAALDGELTKKYDLDFKTRSKIYEASEEYNAFMDAYKNYNSIDVNICAT
jgi:hypothetical protein